MQTIYDLLKSTGQTAFRYHAHCAYDPIQKPLVKIFIAKQLSVWSSTNIFFTKKQVAAWCCIFLGTRND